jgi:hypothetical protein
MSQKPIFVTAIAAALASLPAAAWSELIVNAPRAITHRVSVQIIQTALDDGSSPATVFGNASQAANIESGIDQIWAQAGIDIDFLSNVTRYNNTFAYQGNGGSRPQSDLSTIMASAGSVMNPAPEVINEFFVNIVPRLASPVKTQPTASQILAATARRSSWATPCWAFRAVWT